MKPTNPNAHTYVEDNNVKVSIMTGGENVNAQTYRRTMEQRHCSDSVFSPRQQHWRRNAVARGKQRLPRHASHARRTYHTWNKRTGFAASPIDTAKPRANQRRETRHVGAPKRAFRTRLPPILTLCSFKIDAYVNGTDVKTHGHAVTHNTFLQ